VCSRDLIWLPDKPAGKTGLNLLELAFRRLVAKAVWFAVSLDANELH
jgi:hypothetical protein